MGHARKTWLICNPESGSNSEDAVVQLQGVLQRAGYHVERRIRFPEERLPAIAELRSERVDVLAVFTGDGTLHTAVTGVFGWEGAVLALPGGTMNFLAKRLHGDLPAARIAERLANVEPRRVRPKVVRSSHGTGLTGVLAGPGAIWNEVREALRASSIRDMVATTKEAIAWSAGGPKVVCSDVDCGREDGYAAITVTPHESGLEVKGYYAETLGDYAGQGIALINRNFRDGPHDDLGMHRQVRLVCPEGEHMGLLIDGEPFDGGAEELFRPAVCEVDLLETIDAR
ncbi:MAG TPA: diacylglycerol kinase family protein [Novosphingobium sp.]|nr:diacylglycerol kinase family protein [Novosphingobium sp.]